MKYVELESEMKEFPKARSLLEQARLKISNN